MAGQPPTDWASLRAEIIKSFDGQVPRPDDEAAIIDVFEQNPELVRRAAEEAASAFGAGRIRWPWSFTSSHLKKAVTPLRNATVTDEASRDRAITQAQLWIKTAGLHFDRMSEIESELFGPRGMLFRWRDDRKLRAGIVQYWMDHRPRGVLVRQEEAERANKWKQSHGVESVEITRRRNITTPNQWWKKEDEFVVKDMGDEYTAVPPPPEWYAMKRRMGLPLTDEQKKMADTVTPDQLQAMIDYGNKLIEGTE